MRAISLVGMEHSCTQAVSAWYDDVQLYDLGTHCPYCQIRGAYLCQIVLNYVVGHFTALVWKDTTRTGYSARYERHHTLSPACEPAGLLRGRQSAIQDLVAREQQQQLGQGQGQQGQGQVGSSTPMEQ